MKGVKAVGWGCLAFGAFLLWSAGMSLALWYLAPEAFGPALSSAGSDLPGMSWIRAHWTTYAFGQAVVGAAHVVIGVGLLRLRRWARAALEVMCWLALLGTVASGWRLRSAFTGVPAGSRGSTEGIMDVVAVLLGVAQLVGLALLIVFLRRRTTRAAFGSSAGKAGRAP